MCKQVSVLNLILIWNIVDSTKFTRKISESLLKITYIYMCRPVSMGEGKISHLVKLFPG